MLTGHVFLLGVIFVIDAKDGSFGFYYTHNHWFNHVVNSLQFCVPVKILDALKHLGLYKVSQSIGTDPDLNTVAFYRSFEVDWERLLSATVFFRMTFIHVKLVG